MEDEARQLRAALAQSTATHSRLEAALQSDLAQARAELKEATAGRLAASTARSTADLKVTAHSAFSTSMLSICARYTFFGT